MDEYSRKYLTDVLTACEEVESFFDGKRVFSDFQVDILRQRAVERNGLVINHIPKLKEDVAGMLAE